jgi:hypothetical protein
MADYVPIYSGGAQPFTQTPSGTVTGGQVVVASGVDTVAAAGAGSLVVVGVAGHDAASGAKVLVWPIANCIHEIVTTGTVTALDGVVTAASGTVGTAAIATAAAAGTLIGTALNTKTTGLKVKFLGRY